MSSLFQRIKEIENTEATPCNQSELIEPLGVKPINKKEWTEIKISELLRYQAERKELTRTIGQLAEAERVSSQRLKYIQELITKIDKLERYQSEMATELAATMTAVLNLKEQNEHLRQQLNP